MTPSTTVTRAGGRRFPDPNFEDSQVLRPRVTVNEFGDAFGSRVLIHQKERLALPLEQWHDRIIFAQQHPMVERLVNPRLQRAFDIREVGHHPASIERISLQIHLDDSVVPMQVPAFSFVLEQPVTVTELDSFRDLEHWAKFNHQPAKTQRILWNHPSVARI
jgi:hypothetical protein